MEGAKLDSLSTLELRVRSLERLLLGNDMHCHKNPTIIPTITKLATKTKEAEGSNNNLKQVYAQLGDIERFTHMCHADALEKPADVKIAYIEASEKQLQEEAKHLENVERLKWVLDSEHLRTRITSNLNVKLLQVSERQAVQKEEVSKKLTQTKQLVDNYNKAISAVSTQFEKWNTILSRLEEYQQVVKE
ncbi:dynactin subunit 3-like [Watersipora subatra]|uniref:dynactin subunit 3-like n=1 Tax=Watersipora subatra TaxID=2589382 RepID=UPI00355C7DF0